MSGLYRGKVQNDCPITYMQGRKFPNSSETVKPVANVSNKGLLKNPYNTISEPIAKPGLRPERITTDMWGNVYARSDTMLVPGVTNNNLLKNPFNNLSEPVPEKKVLSHQKIKDINSKNIPEFMRKNVGITDLAMKMLMMIRNKNVKLFTIRLITYLVTKNLNDIQIDLGAAGEQQILQAVNIYNQLIAHAKRINVDYGGNEDQLTENLYPYVHSYVEQLILLIPALGLAELPDIEKRLSGALADLAAVSSALNRLFDQDKAMEPSSILSALDIVRLGGIQAASVPVVVIPAVGGGLNPAAVGAAMAAALAAAGGTQSIASPFTPLQPTRFSGAAGRVANKATSLKQRLSVGTNLRGSPIATLTQLVQGVQSPPPPTGPPPPSQPSPSSQPPPQLPPSSDESDALTALTVVREKLMQYNSTNVIQRGRLPSVQYTDLYKSVDDMISDLENGMSLDNDKFTQLSNAVIFFFDPQAPLQLAKGRKLRGSGRKVKLLNQSKARTYQSY